ncbi:MAG TPA: DUF421 domain-containing protein [Bacillales bacterium]|nr:DUF421 domain-containing protein [Bacillales bacterium]
MLHFLANYIWTPIAVFAAGYVIIRFMGKKAVAEMTGFELLAVLVVGTTISEPVVTKKLGSAIYFSAAIALLYLAFSYLNLNNRIKKWIDPRPTVLVRGGDIDKTGLKKAKMTVEELNAQLRSKGVANVSDVELAALEQIGKFTVIPKSDKRPLQPSDRQLSPPPTFIPIPLVVDGSILDYNLRYLGKDRQWLMEQLAGKNISADNLNTVTLAVYNEYGAVQVDNEDQTDHSSGTYNYKPGHTDNQ